MAKKTSVNQSPVYENKFPSRTPAPYFYVLLHLYLLTTVINLNGLQFRLACFSRRHLPILEGDVVFFFNRPSSKLQEILIIKTQSVVDDEWICTPHNSTDQPASFVALGKYATFADRSREHRPEKGT